MTKARTFESEAEWEKFEREGESGSVVMTEAIEVPQAARELLAAEYATEAFDVLDDESYLGDRDRLALRAIEAALRNNTALEMREAAAIDAVWQGLLERCAADPKKAKRLVMVSKADVTAVLSALPLSLDPVATVGNALDQKQQDRSHAAVAPFSAGNSELEPDDGQNQRDRSLDRQGGESGEIGRRNPILSSSVQCGECYVCGEDGSQDVGTTGRVDKARPDMLEALEWALDNAGTEHPHYPERDGEAWQFPYLVPGSPMGGGVGHARYSTALEAVRIAMAMPKDGYGHPEQYERALSASPSPQDDKEPQA